MNLDIIQVPEPCTVDWNTMTGDQAVRHCRLCQKNVYDLTVLTRRDAEALILKHEGNLCVRFYRRADGTVQTSDCQPVRRRVAAAARRSRERVTAVLAAAFAFALLPWPDSPSNQARASALGDWFGRVWLSLTAAPKPAPPPLMTAGMIAPLPPSTRPAVQGRIASR